MARYGLFVLKVPLNPNQPTNQPDNITVLDTIPTYSQIIYHNEGGHQPTLMHIETIKVCTVHTCYFTAYQTHDQLHFAIAEAVADRHELLSFDL